MFIDTDIALSPARRGPESQPNLKKLSVRSQGETEAGSRPASSYAKIASQTDTNPSLDDAPVKNADKESAAKSISLWEGPEFSFGDLLDIINPLQHVPIVATIYRNLSGDQIGTLPRVLGGAVWGRLGGFIAGVVNSMVEWFTGKDLGDHIYSAIWGRPEIGADAPVVAGAVKPQAPITATAGQAVLVGAELPGELESRPSAQSTPAPRQEPSPITQAPISTPLSSRPADFGGVIPSHVFTSRYRRDDERHQAAGNRPKLRVTA